MYDVLCTHAVVRVQQRRIYMAFALGYGEIKGKSLKQLKGNWVSVWLASLAFGLIFIAGMITVVLIPIMIVALGGIKKFGKVKNQNNMYLGKSAKMEDTFDGLKHPAGAYCVGVARLFFWKSYSYSAYMFIKQETPDLCAKRCITASKNLMRGYKLKRFLLDLSFVFWYLLSFFTLGILLLFVRPYHKQARYNFYQSVKAGTITPIGKNNTPKAGAEIIAKEIAEYKAELAQEAKA